MHYQTDATKFLSRTIRSSVLTISIIGLSAIAFAQAPVDNSAVNKSEREGLTADQQVNGKSDVKLAAEIRRSVVADKSLSTYGHNIKIIVSHGAVTLKGPVHSEKEKQAIVSKASDVVGKDHVTDQIMVK